MRTIFVVDDDPLLGEVLADELAGASRQVRAFSDPIKALAALAEEPADLLITDLSMPWIDGKDIVTATRLHHPSLPILLMSGYSRGEEIAARNGLRFLRKPLELDRLLAAVDDVLSGRDPDRAVRP